MPNLAYSLLRFSSIGERIRLILTSILVMKETTVTVEIDVCMKAFHSKFLIRKHRVFCSLACEQLRLVQTARETFSGSWFTMCVSNRPQPVPEIFQQITQTVRYTDNQLSNKLQRLLKFSFKKISIITSTRNYNS